MMKRTMMALAAIPVVVLTGGGVAVAQTASAPAGTAVVQQAASHHGGGCGQHHPRTAGTADEVVPRQHVAVRPLQLSGSRIAPGVDALLPPAGMSVNSLRQTAAASTLTSHHCEALLRSLSHRHRIAGEPAITWRAAADALDQVTASNQDQPSTVAAAAGDLALWTGRLAYANPAWTLASGPAPAARPEAECSREL